MVSCENLNTERSFFGTSKNMDTPYVQSLFLIGGSYEAVKEYVYYKINGKKVSLLGGGNSIADLLSDENIHPSVVINIDPYITSEKSDKEKSYPYVSLPIKAEDSGAVISAMQERQIDGFDEVWASYSVPYYLENPDEIKNLFTTIKSMLLEGGTARIVPLKIKDNGTNDGVNELINQVKIILDSPEYNAYFVNHPLGGTLFIKKLNKKDTE